MDGDDAVADRDGVLDRGRGGRTKSYTSRGDVAGTVPLSATHFDRR